MGAEAMAMTGGMNTPSRRAQQRDWDLKHRDWPRQYRLSKERWHYQIIRLDHDDAEMLRTLAERIQEPEQIFLGTAIDVWDRVVVCAIWRTFCAIWRTQIAPYRSLARPDCFGDRPV
jgi:hypothetical protein